MKNNKLTPLIFLLTFLLSTNITQGQDLKTIEFYLSAKDPVSANVSNWPNDQQIFFSVTNNYAETIVIRPVFKVLDKDKNFLAYLYSPGKYLNVNVTHGTTVLNPQQFLNTNELQCFEFENNNKYYFEVYMQPANQKVTYSSKLYEVHCFNNQLYIQECNKKIEVKEIVNIEAIAYGGIKNDKIENLNYYNLKSNQSFNMSNLNNDKNIDDFITARLDALLNKFELLIDAKINAYLAQVTPNSVNDSYLLNNSKKEPSIKFINGIDMNQQSPANIYIKPQNTSQHIEDDIENVLNEKLQSKLDDELVKNNPNLTKEPKCEIKANEDIFANNLEMNEIVVAQYKVEFLKFKTKVELNLSYYPHLKNYQVEYNDQDHMYHYYLGSYSDINDANSLLEELSGIHKSAKIIKFDNFNKII